jgi:cytosine/adenosine deaminase-related metal-dependent hydrolase
VILRLETTTGDSLVLAGDRIAEPETKADLTLAVGPGRFHPGLINAHDHLHLNHFPRLGSPPYGDAYAWGTDIHARCAEEIAHAKVLDRDAALLFGALKNILAGVTTVAHHGEWEPAFRQQFPLRPARVRAPHSLGFERDWEAATAGRPGTQHLPLCIHLAEGTSSRATAEVAELAARGLLDDQLLAVHCVGVDEAGIGQLRAARAAVVWCPTSNMFLFGTTAPHRLLESGIDILLGTDSLLTGVGTLLDELRVARTLGPLSDVALLEAVGSTAARRLRVPAPSLEPGVLADVVLLRRPVLEARCADVALVLVGGAPVLADSTIDGLLDATGQPIQVGGVSKTVLAPLARAAERVLALTPECARILQ